MLQAVEDSIETSSDIMVWMSSLNKYRDLNAVFFLNNYCQSRIKTQNNSDMIYII
jgi:hypothetical protein